MLVLVLSMMRLQTHGTVAVTVAVVACCRRRRALSSPRRIINQYY